MIHFLKPIVVCGTCATKLVLARMLKKLKLFTIVLLNETTSGFLLKLASFCFLFTVKLDVKLLPDCRVRRERSD